MKNINKSTRILKSSKKIKEKDKTPPIHGPKLSVNRTIVIMFQILLFNH